jgi:ACS family hexuronate transporter-like MFS transporter
MLVAVVLNASALLALTRAGSPLAALACISLVFFGHAAWGNIILPAEVFPARAVGTVSGIGGCLGAATGVVTQQIIGRLAGAEAWGPLFLGCAVAYLTAQVLVVVLVRELGRLREIEP